MKISKLIVLLILATHAFSQEKASIAVIELDAEGIASYEARIITARIRTELFNTGKFVVLEREKVEAILKEQGFQLSGCTLNECAVKIGRLVNVQKIVTGNIGKIGNLITLSIRLVDVETGILLKTATEDCECSIETVLTKSIQSLSQKLAGNEVQSTTYRSSKLDQEDKNRTASETIRPDKPQFPGEKKLGSAANQRVDGFAGYYPFNGNTDDESGNGNHGIVYGAALSADRFNQENHAYCFDGDKDYIEIIPVKSTYITICAWIKFVEGGTGNPRIISSGTSALEFFTSGTKNRRTMCFGINGKLIQSEYVVNSNRWYFVCGVKDEGFMAIFINGTLVTKGDSNGPVKFPGGRFRIMMGSNPRNGSDEFKGCIDDIRIYSRALTEEEIKLLYAQK